MIDKQHLRDKDVAFRIRCVKKIVHGTVRNVENDGFWIVGMILIGAIAALWFADKVKSPGGAGGGGH